MIKTLRAGDVASGIFLIVIGGVALTASAQIASSVGGMLHPRTLPVILGVLLVVGGGWLIVRARAKDYTDKLIDWPDRAGSKQWWVALALMVFFALLMQPLGFLLTTLIFITAFIWYFGKYKSWVALAWGIGTVVFIYVLFIWLLQMDFPSGPLPY
ncbi:MAG: tripartite tricarboxylate transporter TctB family protein [Chloroflexi bacterium]|nr:tripartite tricarboxylate transporter TctB family protein [Chloroflexota bacterium]